MKKPIFLVAVILLVGGAALVGMIRQQDATEGHFPVSIFQLIVEPEEWEDRNVYVIGYLEGEGVLELYPSQLSADLWDSASGIPVAETFSQGQLTEACGNKYVGLNARFGRLNRSFTLFEVVEAYEPAELQSCYVLDRNEGNSVTE